MRCDCAREVPAVSWDRGNGDWGCVWQVGDLLSPQGQLFLVTVAENDPEDIISIMQQHGLLGEW